MLIRIGKIFMSDEQIIQLLIATVRKDFAIEALQADEILKVPLEKFFIF